MSEKDLIFVVIIGAVIAVGFIGTLASKISYKRFEKRYLKQKRQPQKRLPKK